MESRVNRIRSLIWHGVTCQFHDGTFHVKCSIFDVSWCISHWHGMPCQIDATAHIQFWHGTPCQIWHGFHVKRLDTEFHVKGYSRSVRERFCIDFTRDPRSKGAFKGLGWGNKRLHSYVFHWFSRKTTWETKMKTEPTTTTTKNESNTWKPKNWQSAQVSKRDTIKQHIDEYEERETKDRSTTK